MRKVVISSGGTGGHVFPAQELARELKRLEIEPMFVGGGLKTNRYFNRQEFDFEEISSASPFTGNIFKALWQICVGIYQSWKILTAFRPKAVVGFGSFYSFPVLAAACLRTIPIFIFEPNAIPGKVNRFFSRWAHISAVQFPMAAQQMRGRCIEVRMPTANRKKEDRLESRAYFGLSSNLFTFLVFGGSQGARSINTLFSEAIVKLPVDQFQVIHIAGNAASAEELRLCYQQKNIRASVKSFEGKMEYAWSAADAVVCRSGAATVAEQVAFEVPGILIPFPNAAEDHQTYNAVFIEKQVGGAITCPEADLNPQKLAQACAQLLEPSRLEEMRISMAAFKKNENLEDFGSLISKFLST